MASLNKVFLAGNLTRNPDLRYLPSGMAVAELAMAVNRTHTDAKGERKEETCFIEIVAFGKTAELCNQYLTKGAGLLVEGTLQFETWETESKDKRSRHRVRADRVQFLDRPRRAEGGPDDSAGRPTASDRVRSQTSEPAAPPPPAEKAAPPPGNDDDLPF